MTTARALCNLFHRNHRLTKHVSYRGLVAGTRLLSRARDPARWMAMGRAATFAARVAEVARVVARASRRLGRVRGEGGGRLADSPRRLARLGADDEADRARRARGRLAPFAALADPEPAAYNGDPEEVRDPDARPRDARFAAPSLPLAKPLSRSPPLTPTLPTPPPPRRFWARRCAERAS